MELEDSLLRHRSPVVILEPYERGSYPRVVILLRCILILSSRHTYVQKWYLGFIFSDQIFISIPHFSLLATCLPSAIFLKKIGQRVSYIDARENVP
jgi:hypothetical protein